METRDEVLDVGPALRTSGWILGAMLAASAAAWLVLPEGVRVAVHWGVDGSPDRFAPKAVALLALPASGVLTVAIMAVAPFLDPRRGNLARSRVLYQRAWIGSLLVLALAHLAILAVAFDRSLPVVRVVLPATGLLIAAIGDVLGKSRSNFFAGIRTPWTLSSDLAWEKTHRWTGRLLVAVGLGSALASVFSPALGIALLVVGTFASLATGVALSYVFWKRDPERAAQASGPPRA
jgi:uncharacterized membrane protein